MARFHFENDAKRKGEFSIQNHKKEFISTQKSLGYAET